ncbi:MAG TPA: c-type cytochrome domain-containing protein [Fimbriiglobus sp.]|nr:c-type cytochrome domain-containing protein [Fimbriiglobus sp.]
MRQSLLLLALAVPAKAADKPIPVAPLDRKGPVRYETDVAPIFAAKCQVCHSGKLTEGKFDLGTHAGLMKGGKKGVAIVPGKAEESRLWMMASHRAKPIMPPKTEDNPLTPEEVALLKLWIDQGAKGPAVDVRSRPKVVVGLPPALVHPVRAVAVSPPLNPPPDRGGIQGGVVAAGRGNQVHLFDAKTGDFLKTLTDPELKTPDGKPADAAHLSLVESMAYSPDGKTLATGSFREVVLWDPDEGTIKQRLTGFADRVVTLDYSRDGKYLATGGGAPTEDGEIKVFEADTGKLVVDIKGGHSDTVFGVCFSPDGERLATGGADKFVKVFAVPSGKLLKSFEGHTHHVLDVGWTPDGKRIVSAGADSLIKVWDYEKGEKVRDIPGHKDQVTRLTFVGKQSQFLTAGGDATVRLWNAENGRAERQFGEGKDFVYAVAASADGSVVAAGGEEGVVRLYDGKSGKLVKALLPPDATEPGRK